MAAIDRKKYPRLTAQKRERIIEYVKAHPKVVPTQVVQDLDFKDVSPLQVHALRNVTLRGGKLNPFTPGNKNKEVNLGKVNPEGGGTMALEEKDLNAIEKMIDKKVSNTITTSLEEAILKSSEKIAANLEQMRRQEEEKKTKETQTQEKEKKTEEAVGQIPQLTKTVEGLQTKIKELGELARKPEEHAPGIHGLPEGKKKVFGTLHTSYEDFFSCPKCMEGLKDIITKHGLQKVAKELCGDDKFCGQTVKQLSEMGFKIEEPKKEAGGDESEENKPKPEKPEQKPSEGGLFR